jgi:D-3-phosphoglycerate dehydrogenase
LKILVTPRSFGKANPELFDELRGAGLDVVRNDTGSILSRERMMELLADCHGIIVGVDPLDVGVLDAAPQLKAIAKYGVGLDNIDLDHCARRGIAVSRTLGANSQAVADYAFALMLAVARSVVTIDGRCRKRDWGKITTLDIHGRTLGIVGIGAVGRCVVQRAKGFGMRIMGHDVVWDDDWARREGIQRADVDTICREADVITLHTALTPETRNMLNAERLGTMKPTAILVNTARGELVDEAALLAALQERRIHGAGIDVFVSEPPKEDGWYQLDNVVLGSHCSSSTRGAVETMGRMAVANLLRDLAAAGA